LQRFKARNHARGAAGRLARSERLCLAAIIRVRLPRAEASVTAFQAETRLGELLERVVRGEGIVITPHE